jgi:outer membrane protein OmpA-like peptidoglycan-associated protein
MHESTPVFAKDGKTVYFTRNNYNNGKIQKDATGQVLLKIYKAVLDNDKWINVTELPFNSDAYSVAHPALSPDGKYLYFASDMPGSYGQADIYKVVINSDGSFGTPQNLGTGINTQGKETFPFVDAEGVLYFASDGHPGLGGLDIYTAVAENGNFTKAYNVGEPVNSKNDDFTFIIDRQSKTGFFASNRNGGSGYDDIYSFKEIREIKLDCKQLLTGTVTDKKTGELLPGAVLSIFNDDNHLINTVMADAEAKYFFEAECGKSYLVKSEKEGYKAAEATVTIPDVSGDTKLPIAQIEQEATIKVGADLAKEFKIEQIYFDLAKYDIRADAAIELDKIVNFMKEYPSAKIDVRTHTDCRASSRYNMALSENRAKSVIKYIIENGIDASRLTGRGYGETRLVNKCADGVKCSEAEHQQNRRSEFIVIAL